LQSRALDANPHNNSLGKRVVVNGAQKKWTISIGIDSKGVGWDDGDLRENNESLDGLISNHP
jgi:hypothetical protein